jgi:hypothetical protein
MTSEIFWNMYFRELLFRKQFDKFHLLGRSALGTIHSANCSSVLSSRIDLEDPDILLHPINSCALELEPR